MNNSGLLWRILLSSCFALLFGAPSSLMAAEPAEDRRVSIADYSDLLTVESYSIQPSSAVVGQSITASFIVRNKSGKTLTVPRLLMAARRGTGWTDPNAVKTDWSEVKDIQIQNGDIYTYVKTRIFDVAGNHFGAPVACFGTACGAPTFSGYNEINKNPSKVSSFVVSIAPPTTQVRAGGPYTVAEGGSVSLTGTGSAAGDPTGQTISYSWRIDSQTGTIFATGKTADFSAKDVNGPVDRFVVLEGCRAGTCVTDIAKISVTNVAPSALLVAPPSVTRGSPILLSLAQPSDPGKGDAIEYAFDCGDGQFGAYSASPTMSCPTSATAPPGQRTVRGSLRNPDAPEVRSYSATVVLRDWTARFRDDFEAGLSTSTWEFQSTRFPGTTPAWTRLRCFQPTYSVAPKQGQGCLDPYRANFSTWLITRTPVDLTGAADVSLNFRAAWNLGSADIMRVFVHPNFDDILDGELWNTSGQFSTWNPATGAEGGWRPVEIDLNRWRGQFVYVGFFFSSANDGTQAEGIFLDDVEVAAREANGPTRGAGATNWYFAEGFTGPGFDEFLTIQNPNGEPATLEITYFRTNAPTLVKPLRVEPNSRATVVVHDEQQGVGRNNGQGWPVSVRVVSTNGTGVVVERPMYFTYTDAVGRAVTGGHNVMGVQQPRTTWYFAEGWTGDGFDEYLTILNPHSVSAPVKVTYFLENGSPVERVVTVPARERYTVVVHATKEGVGRDKAVSTLVTTDLPGGIVVERPIYFTYNAGNLTGVTGGHNVMGALEARPVWYFPAGDTRPGWHTYLTLMNPFGLDSQVQLTYYVVGESDPRRVPISVRANSRKTVNVHELGEGVGQGQRLAIKVETLNGIGLVVERPMYFQYNPSINGGHNVMGAPRAANIWLFAEGYTAAGYDEELIVLNPNPHAVEVTIAYQLSAGRQAPSRQLTVARFSRTTILVHEPAQGVGRDQAVSARVETTDPGGIVVERPLYFRDANGIDGGHTVMGFTAPS